MSWTEKAIPHETKVKIRKYCLDHLQKEAAIKFGLPRATVCRIVNEPLIPKYVKEK